MTQQTIHQPKREGGFAWGDTTAADRECGKPRRVHKRTCGACKRTVMLHCDECMIQVTGCLCSLIERMGPTEAYRVLAKQVGQTKARAEFASYGYDMPWLLGLPD